MKSPVWKYLINAVILGSAILYLYLLYYFTIGKYPTGSANIFARSVNVVPFKTITEYLSFIVHGGGKRNIAIINLVGNIVLTMPLAVYIAYFVKPLRRIWKTILAAFVVIISIEVIQFFTGRGSMDVDDVLLNLLGAIVGYGIWKIKPIQWIAEKCQM